MSGFALENALELRVKIDKQRRTFLGVIWASIAMAVVVGWLDNWETSNAPVLLSIGVIGWILRHEVLQHLRQMELRLMFQISPELESQLMTRYREVKSDKSAWKLWGNDE